MKAFVIVAALTATVAAASEPVLTTPIDSSAVEAAPQKLGVFVGLGYLAAPGANGSAASAGIRLAMGRHAALGFDLGWGVISAKKVVHDRWWLMPTLAVVIPVGRVRFDLGAGLGFATASGYDDINQFAGAPFSPVWAFQLVPAARGHLMGTMQLNQTFDAFARLDVGSLLLDGNSVGLRNGNPNPGLMDTMWMNLSLGVAFRLL